MAETLLVISGEGMPPYAVRGITETLTPIGAAANLRRTVNGGLVNLGQEQFLKYAWSVNCQDIDSPAFDLLEIGDAITVDCISELAYKSTGGPSRTVVSGSSRSANGFTFYRPSLTIVITGKSQETDEYGRQVSWSLDGEEA